MGHRFHKYKLLLDENVSARFNFPRLNGLFDVKHLRDDLNLIGLPDSEVYSLAVKQKRLIITYNAKDFKAFASKSRESGVIGVSANLPSHHIDTKLTALLLKSTRKALYGSFTSITGET